MIDGAACQTSAECGALKCIDEVCRDPFAPVQREQPHESNATIGHRMMFGSGNGYGQLIAVMDIAAAAIEPLMMYASSHSSGELESLLGVLCFVPVGLTGAVTHFAHARVVPGIISFFAWTAGAATTFAFAGFSGYWFAHDNVFFNQDAAWAVGLAVGAVLATGLTALDVFMARTVRAPANKPMFTLSPAFVPTRGGALAGLGGSF